MEHDRGKPCHYYTLLSATMWLAHGPVYSSDRACPCHATRQAMYSCHDILDGDISLFPFSRIKRINNRY